MEPKHLTHQSIMPFGRYKGKQLSDIPRAYFYIMKRDQLTKDKRMLQYIDNLFKN